MMATRSRAGVYEILAPSAGSFCESILRLRKVLGILRVFSLWAFRIFSRLASCRDGSAHFELYEGVLWRIGWAVACERGHAEARAECVCVQVFSKLLACGARGPIWFGDHCAVSIHWVKFS